MVIDPLNALLNVYVSYDTAITVVIVLTMSAGTVTDTGMERVHSAQWRRERKTEGNLCADKDRFKTLTDTGNQANQYSTTWYFG